MRASAAFAADHSQAESFADALIAQTDVLEGMAELVAKARTVLEYQGDRRKTALAIAFKDARQAGAGSAAEAEHYARASEGYAAALARLEADSLAAEKIVQRHRAAEAKLEALRSLLSLEKAKITML